MFGPELILKSFSLVKFRQIKTDLGNYSDNPDKYIDYFQHLTLVYELTWKGVMVFWGQTLSDIDQEKVIKEARKCANNSYLSDSKCLPQEKKQSHQWILSGTVTALHLLLCTKAGLNGGCQKAMNYSKVSAISQGLDENPIIFLERQREALIKHTNLDLESYEGQVILKDNFLTPLPSNISYKSSFRSLEFLWIQY